MKLSEDQKKRSSPKMEHFFPQIQVDTGPAREGFRGYIVPGPGGTRAQGARKSSGFRVKFWYRTIAP